MQHSASAEVSWIGMLVSVPDAFSTLIGHLQILHTFAEKIIRQDRLKIITQFKDKIYSARYNAFINEMEVTLENAKVIALNPNSDYVVTFTTTNKVYKAVNYVDDNEVSKKGFLVLLSENEKCSLFKEERIKFYEKTVATTSYDKEIAAKYKRVDDNYYIKLGDKTTFLPQRKKDFLKLFPNEEKKLSTYMKKNKLNPKNEDELISVIKYLSTLIE